MWINPRLKIVPPKRLNDSRLTDVCSNVQRNLFIYSFFDLPFYDGPGRLFIARCSLILWFKDGIILIRQVDARVWKFNFFFHME